MRALRPYFSRSVDICHAKQVAGSLVALRATKVQLRNLRAWKKSGANSTNHWHRLKDYRVLLFLNGLFGR